MTSLLILALCNGALAMTFTKSRVFRAPRRWVADRSDFWGDFVQCPFCISHWLAFLSVAAWRLRAVDCGFAPLDYAASAFALVALSAFVAGAIFRLFTPPSVNPADLQALLQNSVKRD